MVSHPRRGASRRQFCFVLGGSGLNYDVLFFREEQRRFFAVFWVIFQMGTLIGAAIALGIEFHSTLPAVSTRVYTSFMIIMLTAIGTSWLVLPPDLVVRGDGTIVELESSVTPRQELSEFINMFEDWRMLALFPMLFSSNYFYSYQGAITFSLFNGRTRALVSLLSGLESMIGSILIGSLTDMLPFSRRKRAMSGCAFTFVIICVVWGSGLGFQTEFTRDSVGLESG